ncbi:hypothetical protein HQO42_19035 [Rhodococcus fascians]|nr:hypothetical protein [Rhodococcus fascians]MBY4238664.1 hypothetical protein [Rhodococcus fascians]MBY4254747.1 hypothetical protein [Rhodococcus fascians]MBY4270019.1 hypothetical protein [Rhodococcus fascians]
MCGEVAWFTLDDVGLLLVGIYAAGEHYWIVEAVVSRSSGQGGNTKIVARKHVGGLLDINPATIRHWVEKDEPVAGSEQVGAGLDRDAE